MKRSNLSIVPFIILFILITILTTACTNEVQTKAEAKLELILWEQEDPQNDPLYDSLFAEFTDQNPHIAVKRVHYTPEELRGEFESAVQKGQGPDLVFSTDEDLGLFHTTELIQPLDDLLPADLLAAIDPKPLEGCKIKGKLMGFPDRQGNNLMLVYNKKLLPVPPKTLDEMIATAKQHTDSAQGKYGLVFQAYEPFFTAWIANGLGGRVLDEKGQPTLDTPPYIRQYQFLYDIFNVHKIIPQDCNYGIANKLFKEGKAPMIIDGPWSWGEYEEAGIQIGLAELPRLAEGSAASPYISTKAYAVNKNIKDKKRLEAIGKLMAFIGSKAFQLEFAKATGWIPTNKEAMQDAFIQNDPKFKQALKGVQGGTPIPIVPEAIMIWDAMKMPIPDVMAGKLTAEQAAFKAQGEAVKNMGGIR